MMNFQSGLLLSFIPQADIPTYTATFNSNVPPGSTRIGGDAARRVLMQSRLPVNELGRIWELSDTRRAGSLSLPEFMLAMFLAQSRIRGKALPDSLPPKIAAEVAAALASPANMSQSMALGMAPAQTIMPPAPLSMPAPQTMAAPFSMQAPQTMTAPLSMQASHGMSAPLGMQPSLSMPAPIHYAANNEPESIHDFESQFPDISLSPSSGLNIVKQSFINHSAHAPRNDTPQWTITQGERAQYESIFRQWESNGKLRGSQAREVFAQSSLSQSELAKIWMLSDINNQGELNLDEFSVAMHLIFRRLAGNPLPDVLPDELVPRSSRDFMDSLAVMKDQLMFSRPAPASVPPPAPAASISPVADDDDVYQSAHRRRNPPASSIAGTRSQSPSLSSTAESVDQLRRQVQQRREELRLAKSAAEKRQKEGAESRVTTRWRIDDLKREIEDIHRNTSLPSEDSGGLLAKRRRLVASINEMLVVMPQLVRDYERVTDDLAKAHRELGKKQEAPLSDVEARAARLVAQRMAALTGETIEEDESGGGGGGEAERKLAESRERLMSVMSGLDHVARAMRDLPSAASKWDDGVGLVSDEAREFVTKLGAIERVRENVRTSAFSPVTTSTPTVAPAAPVKEAGEKPPLSIAERLALATTKQERDRILQDIAEERFRERQRALGIPDPAPEPVSPARKPEMQERVSVSNPFANQGGEPITPLAAAETFSDDSDEDEWDRDDSSDDDDPPRAHSPAVFGPVKPQGRVESPASSVSFDTAFANPGSPPPPVVIKEESNPFMGLIASTEVEKLRLRALYPYHPDAADELGIETGDLIETQLAKSGVRGDGWLYGEILVESDDGDGWRLGGKCGWFPKDYAETLGGPGSRGWMKTRARFGTAKYDYEPQHEDELKVGVGVRRKTPLEGGARKKPAYQKPTATKLHSTTAAKSRYRPKLHSKPSTLSQPSSSQVAGKAESRTLTIDDYVVSYTNSLARSTPSTGFQSAGTLVKNEVITIDDTDDDEKPTEISEGMRLDTTQDYISKLDIDRPLLIVAGAGSGKTTTLCARVIEMIRRGVVPTSILVITFTNKAAGELKDRIKKYMEASQMDSGGRMPFASTFHSWCYGLIMRNYRLVGLAQCPMITAADSEHLAVLKVALQRIEDCRMLALCEGLLGLVAGEPVP
ncbi:actin organization and endocytosis protein, partial [Coemansia sp. S85]